MCCFVADQSLDCTVDLINENDRIVTSTQNRIRPIHTKSPDRRDEGGGGGQLL